MVCSSCINKPLIVSKISQLTRFCWKKCLYKIHKSIERRWDLFYIFIFLCFSFNFLNCIYIYGIICNSFVFILKTIWIPMSHLLIIKTWNSRLTFGFFIFLFFFKYFFSGGFYSFFIFYCHLLFYILLHIKIKLYI